VDVTVPTAARTQTAGALELRRVSADHWVLRDHAFPPSDSRHVVASLHESSLGEIEVIWLRTDLSLPTAYSSAMDVLQDLASWRNHRPRTSRRPVEIAHYPPRARRA
jgi:hypothetical protein